MSRHRYRLRRRDNLSSAVDDAARVAAKFGPVGALWTGAIGFAVFYAVLPACILAWCEERKAALNGPAAAVLTQALDQVMWHRVIAPCQWAAIAILLVCTAIAVWKYFNQANLGDEVVTFMAMASKVISRVIGR